jgi:voltage-gated sodium channel
MAAGAGVFGSILAAGERASNAVSDAVQPESNLFGDINDLKKGPDYSEAADNYARQQQMNFTQRPFGMTPDKKTSDSYIVKRVDRGLPAFQQGVQAQWRIVSVNGQEVGDLTRQAIENMLEQEELPLRVVFQKVSDTCELNDTIFANIAESNAFKMTTMGMIFLNALAIGWDVDYAARYHKPDSLYETNGKPALIAFLALENIFCTYFTVEVVIRFLAFKIKCYCWRDRWFVFDSFLVLLMVVETWILGPFGTGGAIGQLSVLRLLRISRVARVMRHFPQLVMIVKGMKAAVRAVVWTFLLLVIITYTWAILFTNEYHQGHFTDEEVSNFDEDDPNQIMNYFGSMGKSMLSLLVMGTILDDVTQCTDAIRATNKPQMLAFFILYILVNSFTMMNMLVGILVEVVENTAEGEKQRFIEEKVKESIMRIFTEMDTDGSGYITKEEFLKMRGCKGVMTSLQELDIKEKQFDMYVDLLFQPDERGKSTSLRKQDLIDCIIRLRPASTVSALDFAAFKQSIFTSLNSMGDRVGRIERICGQLCGEIPRSSSLKKSNPAASLEQQQSLPPLANSVRQGVSPTPSKIDMQMLMKLDQASSAEVINELQRRLGLTNLEETGVPFAMMDEDLLMRVKTADAFQALIAIGSPKGSLTN